MALDFVVKDLLPHGEPMVLLEEIESHHESGVEACLQITDSSLFLERQGVPAWVGLEYMGQAIAAFAGIQARERGEPVKVGFLVSSRRYDPSVSHFPLGAKLRVSVNAVTFNTTGLRVFECTIYVNNVSVVTANLNVYMPENVASFMEENT